MSDFYPRSALFMPGSNARAMEKAKALDCDAVIFDLEDAVAPEAKAQARALVQAALTQNYGRRLVAVRTNELRAPGFAEDADLAAKANAMVVPKVETVSDLAICQRVLKGSDAKLWVMIETPLAVLNCADMARSAKDVAPALQGFIIGANDLAKASGARQVAGRWNMVSWFSQVVLAAHAFGLGVMDSVSNNFRDLEAFAEECAQGAALGMDGKTLIHPAQIDACNAAFSPSAQDIEWAEAVIAAFAKDENQDKGAVQIDGTMVERLHIETATATLARLRAFKD